MTPNLRHLLRTKGSTVWAAGAYDALSARIVEHAGFDAIFTTGYGISSAHLGMPDVELWTMTESATVNAHICAATRVPVMCDVDTAFGGPVNAQRTMRTFERLGAAAVVVEDQLLPKRCPLGMPDAIELVDARAAAKKIEAMVAARENPDVLIIGRTDAPTYAEAERRAKLYLAAGADLAQPTSRGMRTFDDLRRLRDALGTTYSVQVLSWLERELTPEQIEEVAAVAAFGLAPLLTAAQALFDNMAALARHRRVQAMPRPMLSASAMGEFIGFGEVEKLVERYAHDTTPETRPA
jgi:2-methylisocitrate lyase-like PEP mutase family enzyme